MDFCLSQMLVQMHSSFMALADAPTLCAKKDIIIDKFDQLLKKLGSEVICHLSRPKFIL